MRRQIGVNIQSKGNGLFIKLLQSFLFVLIPFLGGNHLSFFYITIDKFWIETGFVMFLIISVLLSAFYRNGNSDIKGCNCSGPSFSYSRLIYFFAPFAIITVVSLAYTWNTFSTLNEINTLIWITGSIYVFLNSRNREMLLEALVTGAFLSALCSMVQARFLFSGLIEAFEGGKYAEIVRGQAIPFSSFIYHNVFGGFMCFVLPLAFYFGVFKKNWFYMVAASVIIAGMILSTSRIAIGISLLVVMSLIFLLLKKRDIKGVFIILSIVSAGIIITFMLLQTGQKSDFKGLTRELGKKAQLTKSEVATLNTRTEIWKNGFKTFAANPLIGYGAGSFEYGYRKYFDGGIYTRYAHTLLLKYGVELGIVGIVCFWFYLSGFIYYLIKKRKDPQLRPISISVGCGLLFGLLDFSFDVPAHSITFFVLSSVVFMKHNVNEKKDEEHGEEDNGNDKKEKELKKNSFALNRINPILFVIILCLLGSFFFTARAGLSGKSIENGVAMEDAGFFIDACLSYRDGINAMKADNNGYIKIANILKKLYERESISRKKEELNNSLVAYLEIIENKRDKDSELYFVSGLSYWAIGDTKKAEDCLLKAISFYPSSSYYIYETVKFYFKNNEIQKAKVWSSAINPYLDKYMTSANPKGFYVYKIRDLEAEMEYRQGNATGALILAETNLRDAETGRYIISNIKTGENISVQSFLDYLKIRVKFFKQYIIENSKKE